MNKYPTILINTLNKTSLCIVCANFNGQDQKWNFGFLTTGISSVYNDESKSKLLSLSVIIGKLLLEERIMKTVRLNPTGQTAGKQTEMKGTLWSEEELQI